MIAGLGGVTRQRIPPSLLDRVDAVLDATPLTRRGRFWARLLRHASPIGFSGHLAFAGSAVVDSWRYMRDPRGHLVPCARREVTMRMRDSGARLSVRANTDDILHILPGREKDVHDAILGRLVPGDVVVDVGANVGYYSVLAALRVAPHGSVTAVEPVASTADRLRRNLAANGLVDVRVVEAAVGPKAVDRASVFFDPRYMGRATLRDVAGSGASKQHIRVETLDEICAPLDRITLIKIDVEGGELGVLEGGRRTLERVERVVVECNEDGLAVERLLQRQGFTVSRLGFTNHRLAQRVPLDPDLFSE